MDPETMLHLFHNSKFTGIAWAALACFWLNACSPKTQQASLPVDAPEQFSNTGTREMPEEWWTTFDDAQLNQLIDTALQSNFNLVISWQRIQAAQAVAERESAALVPDLDASIQSGLNFPEPDFVGGENVRLGLNSAYEVDLWGRIHALVDAAQFRAEASQADYQASVLSLAAQATRTWYQLLEAQNQVALVNEQIQTNEQILKLIRARFSSGQVRSVDILRQEQLLAATQEQKINAEAQVEVLEHQLSVLLGQSPQLSLNYQTDSLPDLPPLPDAGIPIELVKRRPDVQAAFKRLQAADRELAAAISNKYPRLSLSASLSIRSNNLSNLFENWAYSVAGNALAPILYGGRLRAEVDRSEAVKQQRLYEYGQTVLTAFQEVENALIQEQKQLERIEVLEEQLRLAQQTYEQLRVGYFNGTTDYLDVLTTLTQAQDLRRSILSARMIILDFRIGLYRALAGPVEIEQAPNG